MNTFVFEIHYLKRHWQRSCSRLENLISFSLVMLCYNQGILQRLLEHFFKMNLVLTTFNQVLLQAGEVLGIFSVNGKAYAWVSLLKLCSEDRATHSATWEPTGTSASSSWRLSWQQWCTPKVKAPRLFRPFTWNWCRNKSPLHSLMLHVQWPVKAHVERATTMCFQLPRKGSISLASQGSCSKANMFWVAQWKSTPRFLCNSCNKQFEIIYICSFWNYVDNFLQKKCQQNPVEKWS